MRESGIAVVLLDVDGTLVDSNDAHASAWVEAFRVHGHPVDFSRVRRLIGMGGDKLIPEVTGQSADSELGHVLSESRGKFFREQFLPHIHAFEGARALVQKMKDEGFVVGIASSAPHDELEVLLARAQIVDLLDGTSSADDVDDSKPDPDVVNAALARLRAPAERAVLVGDTPYDVAAARKAGAHAIGVLSGGWKRAQLDGAIAIYDGVRDFLDNWSSSPLARVSDDTRSARMPH